MKPRTVISLSPDPNETGYTTTLHRLYCTVFQIEDPEVPERHRMKRGSVKGTSVYSFGSHPLT